MVYLVSVWHSSYLLFGLQYACCKDMSGTRNVWYLVSAQIRSGLLLGRPLLFFICMSFRSGISFLLSCSFPDPRSIATGKHCGVTATCILLPFIFL